MNIYLTSTLDLLTVYQAAHEKVESHGHSVLPENAASLEQRLKKDEIEPNIQTSDAVVFLLNGTDINSQFVELSNDTFDPVEAEWEIATRITDCIHAFIPTGPWHAQILDDPRFQGTMNYRLREKVELAGNCTLCESPEPVPALVLEWISGVARS